jgi:hypothetical protein
MLQKCNGNSDAHSNGNGHSKGHSNGNGNVAPAYSGVAPL